MHDQLLVPKIPERQRQERVERGMHVDDVGVLGLRADRPREGQHSEWKWPARCARDADSSISGGVVSRDDEAMHLGQLVDEVVEVQLDGSHLFGAPLVAYHQHTPRAHHVLSVVLGHSSMRSWPKHLCSAPVRSNPPLVASLVLRSEIASTLTGGRLS